jgi:hypothetical protein
MAPFSFTEHFLGVKTVELEHNLLVCAPLDTLATCFKVGRPDPRIWLAIGFKAEHLQDLDLIGLHQVNHSAPKNFVSHQSLKTDIRSSKNKEGLFPVGAARDRPDRKK